jgi:hypothetical protein
MLLCLLTCKIPYVFCCFSDYHPDLGIECLPYHVTSSDIVRHWRGIKFEGASSERTLTEQNTLYVHSSLSELAHMDIRLVS